MGDTPETGRDEGRDTCLDAQDNVQAQDCGDWMNVTCETEKEQVY